MLHTARPTLGKTGARVYAQLAEQIQAHGANIAQLTLSVGILIQDPRLRMLDVGVGGIGQFHDLAHGAGIVALFVRFGNALAGCCGRCE